MINNKKIGNKKRYCVLAAGMTILLCAGIIYGWSVFRGPVAAHLNWDAGAASLTSSIMLAMFVVGSIVGGFAQDKLGPTKAAMAGSVLIGAGMSSTALASQGAPWLVYVTYGIFSGFGVGTVYTTVIAAIQKWFPDRRGFASGMIVSSFGLSLVVFAPLAKLMLGALGVPATFALFGAGFLLVCGFSSLYVVNPPQGYLPDGFSPARTPVAKRQYAPVEIIKTKQYYLLAGGLFFTLPAYFILNPIFMSLGIEKGLSDELALLGVSLTGVCSAAGRLAISWASDKIGRKTAMISIASLIMIAVLTIIPGRGIIFMICIMLIAFGFGGAASVYSATTAESFGTKYGGMNFGLVNIGFGLSALSFPMIANKLAAGGGYAPVFALAAATCAIAVFLVSQIKIPMAEIPINNEDRKGDR